MKKTVLAFVVVTVWGGSGIVGVACSSSSNHGTPGAEAGIEGGNGDAGFAVTLPCTDSDDSVYADPGDVSGQAKGAILKCAHDADLSIAALTAAVDVTNDGGDIAYTGKPFTSGAHVYRVLYRTERGDPNNTPGYSSALVLIPDTPRAAELPVVVVSHGSRGQAAACAPSMDSPQGAYVEEDFQHLLYPLVGLGFAVIAPDLAGYANFGGANNPPSAYADTADVGKSTLDGAAALRNLLPSSVLSQDIALVGHSQGAHTSFSALYMSATYPVSGNITAVAVYSPLWFSQRAWAAIFLEPQNYGLAQSSAGNVSLWYHYTHGELLDGPGHGTDLIQPSQQAVVKNFVDNDCWAKSYPNLLEAGTSANDFFLASYVNGIGAAATPLENGNCNGDPTCTTWIARMTADWPHLTGAATKVPILVWYANGDMTLTPDTVQCVLNRLTLDGVNYNVCYDPSPVGHGGVIAQNANYVADWVAQQTLGGPAPTEACQILSPNDAGVPQITGEGGVPIPCNDLLSTE